jgi:hypothetical protein
MKKTVIVCYQEKEYVCRLVSYLNRNSKNLYLAYAMTKEQEVADYVQKQAVALLLLSEEYETAKWSKKVSQVCVLTEREAAQENEISIYTSAQEIVEYIRLRIREQLEYVRDKLSLPLILCLLTYCASIAKLMLCKSSEPISSKSCT